MARRRGEVGARRRLQIIEAASAIIAEKGMHRLSLSAIEKRTDMSRGQLTYYFRTKEALFDQVLVRPLTAFLESHVEFLQARPDLEGLCEATRSFFRFLGRHPSWSGCSRGCWRCAGSCSARARCPSARLCSLRARSRSS